MEKLIPLLIQLVAGGAGGNIVGALMKNVNMSKLMTTVLGVVGGVLSGQAVDWMGVLQNVLGQGGMGGMLGNAGVSGVGGALLVAIVGMIKKAMAGSAAA